MNCKKCLKKTCPGTCDTCDIKLNARCLLYSPSSGKSGISCFLGLPINTNYEKIIETLDEKICNIFTVDLGVCGQHLLGVKRLSDFKLAFVKLLDYICSLEDKLVKVSSTDKVSGYLYDKITLGNCLNKEIKTAANGSQTLEISIDYACLSNKLPQCFEVNCGGGTGDVFSITSNITTVCGENTVQFAANNCLGNVLWFKNNVQVGTGSTYTGTSGDYYATCNGNKSNTIEITNSGECICIDTTYTNTGQTRCLNGESQIERISNCGVISWISGGTACANCTPIWSNILPVQIFCGQPLNSQEGTTIYNSCKKYIKQNNQCNAQTRWAEYTDSGAETASQCEGCVAQVFTATRDALFARTNCPSGCTSNTVVFTRVYSSEISQQDANTKKTQGLNQFNIDGQAYANSLNDTSNPALPCDTCGCTPSGTYSCSTTGNDTTIRDSCNALIGTITFENPTVSCTATPGYANIQNSVSSTSGINLANYLIEYAITSIGGVAVTSPTYQQGAFFANIDHEQTYEVTCRITRTGQVCSSVKTVVIGTCDTCNTPAGIITGSAYPTTVCGTEAVTLTAVGSNCDTIEWITDNPLQAQTTVGTGAVISVIPTQNTRYRAICRNCSGNYESSQVFVTHTGPCETCTTPLGTISIAASETSICGTESTVLTATSTNCSTISWYTNNANETSVLLGTGNSITVNPTSTTRYIAKCVNCSGEVTSANITVIHNGPCESCIPLTSVEIN